VSLLRLLQIDPRAQVFGSMKPSKKAKRSASVERSTWAIYWSGRTTTTQPRSDRWHACENVVAAFRSGQNNFCSREARTTFTG